MKPQMHILSVTQLKQAILSSLEVTGTDWVHRLFSFFFFVKYAHTKLSSR